MNLREAIRLSWRANRLLNEAIDNHYKHWILENRRTDADLAEQAIERCREQVSILVVADTSGEGELDLSLEAVGHLVGVGLLDECEECEEREDYADNYGGQDHREFHYTRWHTAGCALHALRRVGIATPEGDSPVCEECDGV